MTPKLSVVIIAYNMARELPRTIRSLSPPLQVGLAVEDYELVVVDNGSREPSTEEELRAWGANVRVVRMRDPQPSPVFAINHGLTLARAPLVGVMIDGARMASPGLLSSALLAARLHERPVISSLGFHLGSEIQGEAVEHGYDQTAEDRLLEQSGWLEDGYRLFDVSVLAGASAGGWFLPISESNALFLTKPMWDELGGFDTQFTSPAGGLCNLDAYARACALPGSQLIQLLGEGTFHQVHGGYITNTRVPRYDAMKEEFRRIRGRQFSMPQPTPWFFGKVPKQVLRLMESSARMALEKQRR